VNKNPGQDVTERNDAGAHRHAAGSLDFNFSLSSDLVYIAGIDGWFKRVNPALERTLGYSDGELLGRPYLELVHPDDRDETRRLTADLPSGGATRMVENRYRCHDGSYHRLTWTVKLRPEDGMIVAAARDTISPYQAEQARTLLAAVLGLIDETVIHKTPDGIIVSWNAAAERHYGYRPEEAFGQHISLIIPPERAGEIEEILEGVAHGESVSRDTVRLRKDGARVDVRVTVSPIRDVTGTIVGAVSVAHDITARVKAEQRFRRLVMGAPDAMIIVDSGGHIVLANEQVERLFGYASAELVGQPVEMLVPHQLRDQHVSERESYLAAPQIRRMGPGPEFSGLRRDGTQFPVEVSLSPLDTGEGIMVAALIRDISERTLAEQAMASDRDAALAAAELKSQFVATVSHEIRTPMNGVIGLTDLLLQTPLQPAQLRYAQAIRSSGRALLTIINDILDFSKIEAGKVRFTEADFDLHKLLESVVQVAAEAARDKDLEVVGYYPPELPAAVRGDEGRLRQALLNLLGNAVKFTERGEVLIRACPAAPAPDGRPQVTITVIDTGIGITPDDLALLFQPFSRVDAAANRQFGGTGLGLAISRELIELMGGQLEVSSQPGQGSQFYFTIPLTLQPAASAQPRPAIDCLAEQRLLIVDDNAHSLQLLSEHASAWGMDPTSIPDGRTVVARLRDAAEQDRPYAVAVIDQQMPGLDGVALTRQIIADTAISAVKLVLLTTGSYQDDEVAAAAGAVAVLPKPICPSQMYNCLQDLLDPEAAAQAHLSPARQHTTGGRGLILLAEDNEVNQIVAVDNLSQLGYRVDIARDGTEAVRLAAARPYQAILMDCQMPRMDGYDATAELRRQERPDQHVPIIAMTAGALAEDRQRCLAAGMDDYLAKPIDPHQLRATLIRWVAETRTPAP
jgi:PAS domain S-box-containing protein